METPGIPDFIPHAQLRSAVRTLGIEPEDVAVIMITPQEVVVVRFQRDRDRKLILAGNEYATTTYRVPVF